MVDFSEGLVAWWGAFNGKLSLDNTLYILAGFTLILLLAFVLLRLGQSQFVVRFKRHRSLRRAMRRACQDNDTRLFKTLLLAWFTLQLNKRAPLTLLDASVFLLDADAASAVKTLDRLIYLSNNADASWEGLKCWKALRGQLRDTGVPSVTKSTIALPSLYPSKK